MWITFIQNEKNIDIIYHPIKDWEILIDIEIANEVLVGKGIKKAIDKKIVERFIITKLE